MTWAFPLKSDTYTYELPLNPETHPGAFGAVRRHDIHTGVDLYCSPGTPVFAVEDGVVVEIEIFTGPRAESPWWHETLAILVEGDSGVVCYGEVDNRYTTYKTHQAIKRNEDTELQQLLDLRKFGLHQNGIPRLKIGDRVSRGELITWTKQVLVRDKGKPMCMLHFELYKPGARETVWWESEDPQPKELLDPTPLLLQALTGMTNNA